MSVLGHAALDEGAQQHVLHAVADAADEVARERPGQHRPQRRGRHAAALHREGDERRDRERRRHARSEGDRAELIAPAIKANADYGDGYPLFTALGRPLIAKLAVDYARRTGCDTIAHGCTGKGGIDQVRIESTIATLAPELKVIAPVRSWAMGRDEEIAYARKHGIPVKGGTETAPYSIDDNLWGRSSEGKWIEDLSHAPDDDVFQLVTRPELAPDEAEVVEVTFEAGLPVALDGERLGLVELIDRAAELGIRHGVGIVDHIEDRIVGLKVRDMYRGARRRHPAEGAPGARAVVRDHPPEPVQAGARPALGLSRVRGAVVGAAAGGHPGLRRSRQPAGDGHDRVEALQGLGAGGHASSPNAVYDAQLASFAESGGLFSQQASPGFIELWGLRSRMAHRLRGEADGSGRPWVTNCSAGWSGTGSRRS